MLMARFVPPTSCQLVIWRVIVSLARATLAITGLIMQLTVSEAHRLVVRIMSALGHDAADSSLIAEHLIDCELRGLHYGGLARAVSIAERIARTGDRRRPISIRHETPVSAQIDGGDHLGYIVAHRATRVAVEKASAAGIA